MLVAILIFILVLVMVVARCVNLLSNFLAHPSMDLVKSILLWMALVVSILLLPCIGQWPLTLALLLVEEWFD